MTNVSTVTQYTQKVNNIKNNLYRVYQKFTVGKSLLMQRALNV